MRTFAIILVTSVGTALAVRVADVRAATDTVEARRIVVLDAAGRERAVIDERGLVVIDASGRERIRALVGDDGPAADAFGEARVEVWDDAGAAARSGAVMTDGVRGRHGADASPSVRRPEARVAVFDAVEPKDGAGLAFRSADVKADRVAVVDAAGFERAVLSAHSPALIVRDADGRLRFRR